MREREIFVKLCVRGLEQKNLIDDQRYQERFKKELKEIDAQAEHEYYLGLYSKFQKEGLIYPRNEWNNLVDYLLDLTDEFDIEKDSVFIQGEFPDIDIDFIKPVRDYLKREWAADNFGQEYVCEIGTYGTSGIKSSLLDNARLYSVSHNEIQPITANMEDKDEEGDPLTWDTALEMYEDLRNFCKQYPEVADASKTLLHRNRSGGVHAGGLIISSKPINSFVPLEVRSVNKTNPNGVICSAWTEGLNAQDLQPVGLIKFDLLVISNLMQIALACKLIKERHPDIREKGIAAHPGSWDWSDISYLNDPKAIDMANQADLKCIFQFDSEGIRKLVKRGGVTSFDDLAAYSALYRPGPLNEGMDARYCKRKRWDMGDRENGEPWNLRGPMQSILGKTYGVMVFQEQVQEILRVVGEIPDMHTEKVRKAISKKQIGIFAKYKDQFLKNGQKVLDAGVKEVSDLWDQIEAFASYGFNKSVPMYTKVSSPNGIKEIKDFKPGDKVYCVNKEGKTVETDVVKVHNHGVLDAFEVKFDDGSFVECSIDHKFLTEKGQMPLREICRTSSYILCDQYIGEKYGKRKEEWMESQVRSGSFKQARASRTQEQLSAMQRFDSSRKVEEFKTCDSLWSEMFDQSDIGRTSQSVSELQGFGMGWITSQFTLRERFSNVERSRESSQGLQNLRSTQRKEYPRTNGKTQQGQRASRSQEDIFRDSQENFGSTRDSSSTCCTIEKMERGESRKVCEMHRGCVEESQEISNGSMASRAIGMGYGAYSVWRKKKTSRFCERQSLDRSGRVLSLLRASKQWTESISFVNCPTEGRDVKGRMSQERRCDADSDRHDMFQEQFESDAGGMVRVVEGHAPITDTGSLVSRRIVGVRYVGKRQMCDLEVSNATHNFLLSNGVVTSNSHSYAYTYISSRLLYLKAHYPTEFYTAIMMCEDKAEKFREYKFDAYKHDVNIRPVHINKSKENFVIDDDDDDIYFGFGNIKGMGEDISKRVVENQPYKDFRDFLNRFGTDLAAIKAFVSLGIFEEDYDRIHLRKFSEYYKDKGKKRKDRQKRFEQSLDKKLEELREALLDVIDESDKDFEVMSDYTEESREKWKERFSDLIVEKEYKSKGEIKTKEVTFLSVLEALDSRRQSSIDNFEMKEKEDDESPITIDQFNPNMVNLDEKEIEVLNDEMVVNGEVNYPKAEELYYGFQWHHVLETSPDYSGEGFTIDSFLDSGVPIGTIEVIINSVTLRTSKKGTKFYSIMVQDANSKEMKINVWQDDYNLFEEHWKQGNMVRINVRPPSGGFNTLTLDSIPKHKRKYASKEQLECRLRVMRKPEPPKKEESLVDFTFDEDAVEILE